jgi:D-alanine-D-alanine ligase
MHIGLTYDLRSDYLARGWSDEETAEFDRPETIDALDRALDALGHSVDRIGSARQLIERLAAGQSWDLVLNICEGYGGIAREAHVPSILDVYGIPYTFSDAAVLCLTLHKGHTKTILRDAGIDTAPFFVVHRPDETHLVPLDPPLFVKPIAEGTSKGIDASSIVRDRTDLEPLCHTLLEKYQQPVLIETFLPGRELTVGMLGTGSHATVLGSLEVELLEGAEPQVYSYANKERCEVLVRYRYVKPDRDEVVRRAEELALRAWKLLGCRDAGRVDLRADAQGFPQVLEINPLAGLHPSHSDLPILCQAIDMPYVELIDRIIRSASARVHARFAGSLMSCS